MHPPPEAHCRRATVAEGLVTRAACGSRPAFPRDEGPEGARHAELLQHRRRTPISLACHFSLLPLGKSRWAKPNVAFRGRVAGSGGGKRSSKASRRSNVARRRAAGAQRARSNATDESLLSEGASAEAAWPRSQTADGGRTRARRRARVPAQNDEPGCSRKAISSAVDSRPRMRLRWGKRPKRTMTSRCLFA